MRYELIANSLFPVASDNLLRLIPALAYGRNVMKLRRKTLRISASLAAFGLGSLMAEGCFLQSDIVKRFREGYEPGFVSGVTNAITDPDNAEDGVREAIAAAFEGLGAVIGPRSPSSTGGG